MPTRLAILETIAQQNSTALRDLRGDMRSLGQDLRGEMHQLRGDVSELRRNQERDFRVLFGAIITTTLALAALIAHVAHWL